MTAVLAICSEKGGAGKTTLAVNLAVAGHLAGFTVAIIDLDPQASATLWAADREASSQNAKIEAVAIPPAMLERLLAEIRQSGTDLVIIDTPREAGNAGYKAAQLADLVLVPFKRGGFDFRALDRTIDLCRLAGTRPYLVLNGLRPGARRIELDARDALGATDCVIAPIAIHHRAGYETASLTTQTVQEREPGGDAAREIAALFTWIAGQVRLSTTTITRQRTRQR